MKTDIIGTEAHPISISGVPGLVRCPLYWCFVNYFIDSRESSEAADTGTAVGRAVELYHRKAEVSEILAKIQAEAVAEETKRPFGGAKWNEVEVVLEQYSTRFSIDSVLEESLEGRVEVCLAPHPADPTRQDIHFVGHLDQLRHGPGNTLELWDIKHSGRSPLQCLAHYALQQALYLYAARERWGYDRVVPGGILFSKDFLPKRKPVENPQVLYRYDLTEPQWAALIDSIRLEIALMRMGEVRIVPSYDCSWCPAGGLSGCLSLVK